ncbi:hypothetical protein BBO99_00006138 [Phytophthora kernoviae]|uniref:Sulfatase N-terminal domain-containing protein n=2 Tax=Phytophthora kernoviae TaxID=325452 RepID=A0A3R7J4V4_9STRA|nr:hypothetical protein G195_006955 [Phytophthora kernoviae 00238/432]KAG2522080.1 hypothetical protein JM16_005990 [Phytophthora kernoviae]KAG2523699.1 hypothetical protein JM18_005673 [Phytophthora kernoviae]RLN02714.1 hypothetical protein BBI17_006278 [Phytophthora kernoviae]RLN78196.1 hypothetical protein BBO99_00006138 [Phytophthora kernoviae]
MYTEMVILEEYREESETKSVRRWGKPAETIQRIRHADIWNRVWLGWAFVYTVVLLLFSIYRLAALHELITMYGTRKDCTAGVEAGALGLGFLEDFVCTTYFVCALWLFDALKRTVSDWVAHRSDRSEEAGDKWTRQAVWIVEGVAIFLVSWLLFIAMMGPFVADLLLVRLRDMRFTFELVAMAIHEKDNAGAAAISESELTQGYLNVTALVIVATFFATVRTWSRAGRKTKYDDRAPDNVDKDSNEVILELGEAADLGETTTLTNMSFSHVTSNEMPASTGPRLSREMVFRLCILVAILLVILVVIPAIVLVVCCACSSLVAYSALNTTINEFFVQALDVTTQGFTPLIADGSIESAQVYIHSATEEYTLFQDDALYRRTTGFRGDLAFDVNVSDDNPPNVLLIVVESFRFHDSHYLVGDEDPSNLFKGTNITITPNFDKWAKRVWSRDEMMELAESDLGITSDEWYGDDNRGFNWGVHDDLSFQLLGDLLVNKTTEQNSRIEHGEAKKPVFLTHYTISSHTPFKARPKWYADADKPDFSALYEGEEYADFIKDYLEMRYFTDMQLGKFLDRMADENVLNDTIIVIVGDHGQAPEFGEDMPEARDTSVTRVAGTIIAEGRLGDAAGLNIEDAVEQYDILNTLADITGVPDGGFLQDGIGRSLKRNDTFGERVVYSNNPSRKMSVVRGHDRLRYDRYSNSVLLHNADTDHDMDIDLFPNLNRTEKMDWNVWRDNGRRLNGYYTKRWDKKCLLAGEC